MTTTAGQPYHSTKILHGPPSKADVFVDVQNSWDSLAEAAIASYPESSTQLDYLAVLLESHGIVVHRVSAPQSNSPFSVPTARSPFVTDPYVTPTRMRTAANGIARETNPTKARHLSLFPQNAALVYGTRVIEVPPPSSRFSPEETQQRNGSQSNTGTAQQSSELFSFLENAGAEVVKWQTVSPSSGKPPEGKLVNIEETTDATDTGEEGPRFSPSDIIILSPTLLITRLSPCTNNKGLEYLWSVLSRPAKPKDASRHDDNTAQLPASGRAPVANVPNPPRATTTLLVRITEPDVPAVNSPAIPPSAIYSPRTPSLSAAHLTLKHSVAPYTPLCRVLVPIDGRVMLYDPALVAEGEARRLKSVLDRVQEGSKGTGNSVGEMNEFFARSSKRDSVMSYGTFGSTDKSDDDGWQFISVDGLHSTSIFLVSPRLALLSYAPSTSTSPTSATASDRDSLANVSQVLESLGVRTVSLPTSELNEKGGGVRDAIMVLRREPEIDLSDDGPAEDEQHNTWDRQLGAQEEPTERCFEAMTAAIATFFCGVSSAGTSEDDMSG